MKKDLEILSIFEKNETVREILNTLGKEVEIKISQQIPIRYEKEPELVDLGLPSGNLWMKCNLGAKTETEYGLFYQFGSLVGYQGEKAKSYYSFWKTCPFNNGKDDFDEEYFLKNKHNWFDKDNNLKPEYDVVTQTYWDGFKIPSEKDIQELLDNTTQETIRDYKNSGKKGRLFTSKVNGKSIYIPFSGYIWEDYLLEEGNSGRLWSSGLNSSGPEFAYDLYCTSGDAGLYSYERDGGFTIRGIKVKRD